MKFLVANVLCNEMLQCLTMLSSYIFIRTVWVAIVIAIKIRIHIKNIFKQISVKWSKICYCWCSIHLNSGTRQIHISKLAYKISSVHFFFSRNSLINLLSQLMELECVCTCKCKVLVDPRNFTDRKRAVILNYCISMNLLVCEIAAPNYIICWNVRFVISNHLFVWLNANWSNFILFCYAWMATIHYLSI